MKLKIRIFTKPESCSDERWLTIIQVLAAEISLDPIILTGDSTHAVLFVDQYHLQIIFVSAAREDATPAQLKDLFTLESSVKEQINSVSSPA